MWKCNGNGPCLVAAESSRPCLFLAGVLLVLLCPPYLPGTLW